MSVRKFEVIVDDLEKNPHCLHGPTLVFRKSTGKCKDYYACSAFRDQKSCNFYLSVNEKKKVLLKSSSFWKEQQKKVVSFINKCKPYKKFIKILRALKNNLEKSEFEDSGKKGKFQAGYCYTCNALYEKSDFKKHDKCNFLFELTPHQLIYPTSIIIPKTDSKTHAQYFFSETSVKDIHLLLSRLSISKILCIGTPRIHEYVLNNCKNKIKSLLLDFDKNYFNFYSKKQFIWYNMFNNYIFDERQKETLYNFLHSDRIIILIDPPFGGRVEPLARTLNVLKNNFLEINRKSDAEGFSHMEA